MNLWLSVIDQGTGISLPIGTSLDAVPICELVPDDAIVGSGSQEFECTMFIRFDEAFLFELIDQSGSKSFGQKTYH